MCKAGKEGEDEEEDDWEDEDVEGEEDIQLRGQTLSDLIDSMAEFNGDNILYTDNNSLVVERGLLKYILFLKGL